MLHFVVSHASGGGLILLSAMAFTGTMATLTHWPLEDLNLILDFQANFSEWWLRYLLWNCPQMNATRPYWW